MTWLGRRMAYVAPIVVVEPSKSGPDAVLECDDHWAPEHMASLKAQAEETFGMRVVVLDGAKVARIDCGALKKRKRWHRGAP
jgi:hypothetical protein